MTDRFNSGLCGVVSAVLAVLLAGAAVMFSACGGAAGTAAGSAPRIVSVGGSITETIFALDAGEMLVGTDTSSVYPADAAKLPQVGYQRTLSAEGVISLAPTLVIISRDAGPPTAIEQVKSAGIRVERADGGYSVDETKEKIRRIADLVGSKDKGEAIITKLDADMAAAREAVTQRASIPKVVFIFSRGSGAAQVSGTGTPADAMIKLAGGQNAVTGFELYKPLTPEAMVAAQPDVILLPSRGLESMGGLDAILAIPGVSDTPAGKNRKIIAIDDVLLLGFTPRLGIGVRELAEKLR